MQKVQAWRTALTASANLKGYDIRDRIESECIQELVDNVSFKLCKTSSSYLQDIVGIDTHLGKIESQLEMEIIDVRILGIWGMGGVGKTTIARAIFDTLSPQFQGACFLADVKETNTNEMHSLQNIILSQLLREDNKKYVNNKEDCKRLMAHRLRFMKVLVVLDDINHHDHREYLAGDLRWFGSGCRIIATTRNKQIIGKNNAVYEVTTLFEHDAIQLFDHCAFKDEAPDGHIMKLALEVVSHAKAIAVSMEAKSKWLRKPEENTRFYGDAKFGIFGSRQMYYLEEIHHSLKCSRKLIELNLYECESLKRFPYVNVEFLDLDYCSNLEKFPEIDGKMKPELKTRMSYTWDKGTSIIYHSSSSSSYRAKFAFYE